MTSLETLFGETTWPEGLPERLSPSSISEFGCPEKWRRKRLLGERTPWAIPPLIGSVVHRAVETNYQHRIEQNEYLPSAGLPKLTSDAFDKFVEEVAKPDGIEWGANKVDDVRNEAMRLVDAHAQFVAPDVVPIATEEWVEAMIPGLSVPVVGRIDVRTEDGIVDTKTTTKKPAHGNPRGDWRLKALVYTRMTGLSVEWHVLTRTKTVGVYTPVDEPGLRLHNTQRTSDLGERRILSVASQILYFYSEFGRDKPWPTSAPEHDWLCDYCGLKADCFWWGNA